MSPRGIIAEVSTVRHHADPSYQPLFKTDKITLKLRGWQRRSFLFRGGSTKYPDSFQVADDNRSATSGASRVPVSPHGIGNGLYSLHIQMLDGIDGGATGVMVLHDAGFAAAMVFFDYIGSYTCANGKWKARSSITSIREQGRAPVFGGHEVASVFRYLHQFRRGSRSTALAGKRSIRSRRC